MKKVVRVTVKKMQRIFAREHRGPAVNSQSNVIVEGNGMTEEIEHGLEVKEEKLDEVFRSDSSERLQQANDLYGSSDEENPYTVQLPEDNRHSEKCDVREGASGPLTCLSYQNNSNLRAAVDTSRQVAPYYKLPTNTSYVVAHTTCGSELMEKKCSSLPIELQTKISEIKETLLYRYPPYYDFCVISSDDDYEEALQFKEYVSLTFGLAGCTLYDGFISLGSDMFDSYALMMNQSSKVFFFVTETFTRNEFCRRLQNGAVFDVLMSKVKCEREKCVPVFPNGFCRAPLALSGIAGLNPTQREVTRRSLDNTYTRQIRQRRLVKDIENFEKRCIEFETEVNKCITDYQSTISQQTLSITNLDTENVPSILGNKGNCIGESNTSNPCLENNSHQPDHSKIAKANLELKYLDPNKNGNIAPASKSDSSSKLYDEESQNTPEYNKTQSPEAFDEDILDKLPIPEEMRNILKKQMSNNAVSYITDCGTVHIGPSIQFVINQVSGEDPTNIEHILKNSFPDTFKEETDLDSDSSDDQ